MKLLPGMTGGGFLELHDLGGRFEPLCRCARCSTLNTAAVSPATSDHIFGTFDVEKARMEARHEAAANQPYSWRR